MKSWGDPLLRIASLAVAVASILAAAPVGRAQAPAVAPEARDNQPEPEIVVVATQDQREAIRDYVNRVTVETRDQIATFWDRVCPASFGLPATYNQVIERRVREVAGQAGIRTAPPGCFPNVVIIVADGPFIDRLHHERPDIFRGLALSDIRSVLRDEGPIQAWQVVVPRGSDGRPLEHIAFLEMGGRVVYVGDAYLRRGLGSSLTQKQTRQDLSVCFVVFDLDAVEGLTLTQIADYAAMRTLARTSPASIHGRRTILSLFNDVRSGDAPAEAMTGWDAAYLRALYATNSTVSSFQQRSNMVLMIERESARSQDAAPPQAGR